MTTNSTALSVCSNKRTPGPARDPWPCGTHDLCGIQPERQGTRPVWHATRTANNPRSTRPAPHTTRAARDACGTRPMRHASTAHDAGGAAHNPSSTRPAPHTTRAADACGTRPAQHATVPHTTLAARDPCGKGCLLCGSDTHREGRRVRCPCSCRAAESTAARTAPPPPSARVRMPRWRALRSPKARSSTAPVCRGGQRASEGTAPWELRTAIRGAAGWSGWAVRGRTAQIGAGEDRGRSSHRTDCSEEVGDVATAGSCIR